MNDADFKAHRDFADTNTPMRWLALDPGTTKTGWVIFDPVAEKPVEAGWEDNATVLWRIEILVAQEQEVVDDEARRAAQTPEEQEAERRDLLQQFFKGGGMAIKFEQRQD